MTSLARSESPTIDVLVVDDDDPLRSSLLEVLRAGGYRAEGAPSARAALSVLSLERVGVLLLDVRMPGLSGLDLLDAVPDPPPVLLMTAQDFDGSVMSRWRKVAAWLPKPIPPDYLCDVVWAALNG